MHRGLVDSSMGTSAAGHLSGGAFRDRCYIITLQGDMMYRRCFIAALGLAPFAARAAETLRVVASFSILGDLTRRAFQPFSQFKANRRSRLTHFDLGWPFQDNWQVCAIRTADMLREGLTQPCGDF